MIVTLHHRVLSHGHLVEQLQSLSFLDLDPIWHFLPLSGWRRELDCFFWDGQLELWYRHHLVWRWRSWLVPNLTKQILQRSVRHVRHTVTNLAWYKREVMSRMRLAVIIVSESSTPIIHLLCRLCCDQLRVQWYSDWYVHLVRWCPRRHSRLVIRIVQHGDNHQSSAYQVIPSEVLCKESDCHADC